jgi:hypothetical protein
MAVGTAAVGSSTILKYPYPRFARSRNAPKLDPNERRTEFCNRPPRISLHFNHRAAEPFRRLGAKPFPTEPLPLNVTSRRSTATALLTLSLDRRTRNGSERAEHTTLAGLPPKDGTAALALIEILAGVGWHCFGRFEAADWTGNR